MPRDSSRSDPGEATRPLRPAILVVDDDPGVRESFRLILEDAYDVLEAPDGLLALDIVRGSQVEVILVTAVKTVKTAVAAMKLGAFDYVTKPFEEEELLALIRRALEKRALEREVLFLRSELARRHDSGEIVGQHAEMQRLYRLVAQVARTATTVLITGESGTGKELIARAIHRQGPRRDKPFVAVNPAAVSETLVESELFGHEKGGTLFLDEVTTLKPDRSGARRRRRPGHGRGRPRGSPDRVAAVIQKPFTVTALAARVREVLDLTS